MEHPAKEATPLVAVSGLVVQARLAPLPGCEAMAKVIEALELVTVLPDWSWTVTTGWVPSAAPSTPVPGWVVKASLVAVPGVTEKLELVVPVRPGAAAVKV